MTKPTLLERCLHPLGLAALAFLLTLPSLGVGIGGDDYFHRMLLLGRGEVGAKLSPIFDLFSFVPESQRDKMVELGVVPWWSDPQVRIALGRPLTAVTHWIDYALWPDNFVLQHVHSLLWFALGVALVAILFRRIHGNTAGAGLAGLLFAVEDAHALPAGWLANRNALLCLVFGTLTILFHLSGRASGRRSHLAAALLALVLGLGCGEATIGSLAYVTAWELTEEKGTWFSRLTPLAPYALVVLVWRTLYDQAGYGTLNSALYVDPGHDPVTFGINLLERWPLLLAAQWFQAPIDIWLALSRSGQLMMAAISAIASVCVVALVFDQLFRERLARFWFLGMALSIIPVCAAFPMDRLLVFAGIGAFGVMAMLFRDVEVWPWRSGTSGGWRRPAALILIVLHVPIAAVLLVGRTAVFKQVARLTTMGARLSPHEDGVKNQTFIYVNGNDFLVLYTWIVREAEGGGATPRRIAQLSSMLTTQIVRREDATTLTATSRGGYFDYSADQVLKSARRAFVRGDRIVRPDFTAEIRSTTADGRPLEVAFHFRNDLDDPQYRWLYWNDEGLRTFALPRVGESLTLPGLFD